jgi:cyclopropane fatty-acyl-phospholipid synthase-like methyltransferase
LRGSLPICPFQRLKYKPSILIQKVTTLTQKSISGGTSLGNRKIKDYYENLAEGITSATETRNKAPDFTAYDVAFVKQFSDPRKSLLDMGAGTGLLLNRISDEFQTVTAVELYPEFSKFITPKPHLQVVNQNILDFESTETFDIVIAFGVMNFFSKAEAKKLYKQFFKFMAQGGTLIIKNQMGVAEDVIVDQHSEELGQHYYSEYRTVSHESKLISAAGFSVKDVHDIYPGEFNRWPNTRFQCIVASK